jgi:hypothetical protein
MFVDENGQYGSAGDMILLEYGQLTELQWQVVSELDGFDRYRYIQAVLDNDPLEQAYILGEDI